MPNPCLLRCWTDSLKVNALDAFAERFLVRLMQKSDDYGRFHDDPQLLKSALFPLLRDIRETDIARWRAACVQAGLLRSYRASNGRNYLEVLNFNQRRKWMKSEHPPPEGQMTLLPAEEKNARAGRSRSRREEKREPATENPTARPSCAAAPPVTEEKKPEIKKPGPARPMWQLLNDEKAITDRIGQETNKQQPDKDLITVLKRTRATIRAEMKTVSQ
jgi:hypothetical protein